MQAEIEAKFLDADHNALRAKLKMLGAECTQPMRLMRRNNFDFPDLRLQKQRNGWARVRDEGDKVTMSYKQLDDRSVHGTKEVDVTVDNFDRARSLLEALGLESKMYQETRRESWRLGEAQIELDHWPWTKPYVEIEASSEAVLRETAEKLGLDWKEALHGSVEVVYQAEYDVADDEIYALGEMTFDLPIPKLFAQKRRKT